MEQNQAVGSQTTDVPNTVPQSELPPAAAAATVAATGGPEQDQSRGKMILAGIIALVILVALVVFAIFLVRADPMVTSQIRDVFIIFMALESLVIGIALIILVIQLAVLINLIQNELKPIISSTNETVSTLRGTVKFLSDNLAEPVIKLNAYLAGAKKLIDLVRPDRW